MGSTLRTLLACADVPWTSGAVYTEAQRAAADKIIADRDAAEAARLAALRGNESVPLVYLGWPRPLPSPPVVNNKRLKY